MKPTTRNALLALRAAGGRGMTTRELIQLEHKIGTRYSARFTELRKLGCEIGSERERQGSQRFWLLYEPPGLLDEEPAAPKQAPAPIAPEPAGPPGEQLGLLGAAA